MEVPLPVEPCFVTGTARIDTNANGAWDADEPGMPGVGVELMRADGSPAGATTTGGGGGYTFSVDEPGAYFLRFAPPEGFRFTTPDFGSDVDPGTGTTDTFDVAPTATVTRDAGLVSEVPEEAPIIPEETKVEEET